MRADVMGKLVLRAYTIVELDQMREALRVLVPGRRGPPIAADRDQPIHGQAPMPTGSDIEDQLRTHMINGTDPADLIAAAAVRAVDNGVASRQAVVDRCRNAVVDPDPRFQRTVGEWLLKLRRAVIELERFKTLNGR